jgi:predicted RNase H-like HicB family nuclease
MKRFIFKIDRTDDVYRASSPDIPGKLMSGKTLSHLKQDIKSSIVDHLNQLRKEGLDIGIENIKVDYIEVK